MGTYTLLYDSAITPRLTEDVWHGSTVRDALVEAAAGKWSVDDHADKWLAEGMASGRILAVRFDPTVSQSAFYGLQCHRTKTVQIQSDIPGTREHWWYRWSPAYQQVERLLAQVVPLPEGPQCHHARWSDPVAAQWGECPCCGYRGWLETKESA